MTVPSYSYEQAAEHYICVIERDSRPAAAVLRALPATAGARAALRVALVLMEIKADLLAGPSRTSFKDRESLFLNSPEARAGFEEALASCLHAWKVRSSDPVSADLSTPVSRIHRTPYQ
jgi:hypothetical protein